MDEYQIIERVKDWYKTGQVESEHNFLFDNKTIISVYSYERSYEQNPSINKQVTGYVYAFATKFLSGFEFPMLVYDYDIPLLYLYKIGYIREDGLFGPVPLPNLKYYIVTVKYRGRLAVELVDLDVIANNINLPKIVSSVLGPKLLRENNMIDDELYEIQKQMLSQKLFADHTLDDADDIVYRYFDKNERELSKEVFKISQAYERVFRPRRVVYNTKTWQPLLVW